MNHIYITYMYTSNLYLTDFSKNEICSHVSEKASKGRFPKPRSSKITVTKEKPKKEKKEKARSREKAMVELLGFIMATLAQKHCSRRKCPFGGNVFKNLPRVPEGFFPVVCGEIFAANKRGKKPSGTQGIKNPTRYINLIMSIKYTMQHSLHLISEGNLFQRGCYLE